MQQGVHFRPRVPESRGTPCSTRFLGGAPSRNEFTAVAAGAWDCGGGKSSSPAALIAAISAAVSRRAPAKARNGRAAGIVIAPPCPRGERVHPFTETRHGETSCIVAASLWVQRSSAVLFLGCTPPSATQSQPVTAGAWDCGGCKSSSAAALIAANSAAVSRRALAKGGDGRTAGIVMPAILHPRAANAYFGHWLRRLPGESRAICRFIVQNEPARAVLSTAPSTAGNRTGRMMAR